VPRGQGDGSLGRILGFLDMSRYFSIKLLLSCTHEAEWTHYFFFGAAGNRISIFSKLWFDFLGSREKESNKVLKIQKKYALFSGSCKALNQIMRKEGLKLVLPYFRS
jgi:hypothetical protein